MNTLTRQRRAHGPSRRHLAAGLAAILLILLGGLAAWFLFPRKPPEPFLQVLTVSEYKAPGMPYLEWADQDRERLHGIGWKSKDTFVSQERHRVEQVLSQVRVRTDEVTVLSVAGFALSPEPGRVYLLPGDASLDNPQSWLPLDEVLEAARACGSPHKLLLLDLFRPWADPRLGVLADDVAERALPLLEKAVQQDPHLHIFCACSPGQVSWAASELGQSVFVHFLCKALTEGTSLAHQPWGRKGRVTAHELARWVTAEVDAWVAANRPPARQTPLLLGGDRPDFELAALIPTGGEASAGMGDYPDWLRKGWELRDRWRNERGPLPAPAILRGLEAALLRAERRFAGGENDQHNQNKWEQEGEEFRERHDKERADQRAKRPGSLAWALAEMEKPAGPVPPEALDKLTGLFKLDKEARAAKPAEKDKVPLAPAREAFLKKFGADPLLLARVLWQAALDDIDPGLERFQILAGLLRSGRATHWTECRFLARLGEAPGDRWHPPSVAAALKAVQLREQIRTGDRRALLLLQPLLVPALAGAAEAEKLLFAAVPPAPSPLETRWQEVWRDFRTISRHLRALEQGFRQRDDALTQLWGLAGGLTTAEAVEHFKEAVAATGTLRDLLNRQAPPAGQFAPFAAQVAARTRTVGGALARLQRGYAKEEWGRLLERLDRADRHRWDELEALLQTPQLSAADRVAVFTAARDLADRLTRAPAPQTASPPAWTAAKGEQAAKEETARARGRARVALLLLQLDGSGKIDAVEAALREAEQSPADAGIMSRLGRELRRLWAPRSAEPAATR